MRPPLVIALAALVGSTGCGYGLLQTAHTTAPKHLTVAGGGALAFNQYDDQHGKAATTSVATELSGRFGLTDHLDVGVGSYILPGARIDAKLDVLDPDDRFAFGPRLGASYGAMEDDKLAAAFVGGIASYDVLPQLTPYAGVTYATHWIYRKKPTEDITLAPNETLSARKGYGDGLVQLAVGLSLRGGEKVSFLAEAALWLPAQNDPGDYFRFVTNRVFAGAVQVGF